MSRTTPIKESYPPFFSILVRQVALLKGPILLLVFLLLWSMGPTTEIRFPHAHITLAGLALLQIADAWFAIHDDPAVPASENTTQWEAVLLGLNLAFCYLLVRFTGGIESKYSLVFLLPILTGATRYRLSGALAVTLAALVLYGSFMLTDSIKKPDKQIEETIELLINMFFSFVIGFVIALASQQERNARLRLTRSNERIAAANEELRRAQEELQHKVVELESMEQAIRRADRLAALGEMASGMAHEIRTPLGVIQSSAETLARRVLQNEPGNRLVTVIVDEITRLNRLINDFLGFASPQPPTLRRGDIAPVVERTVRLAEALAAKRDVRLAFRAAPGLHPVAFDENLLHQCVMNLLVNSIDATPAGGAIEVRLGHDAGRGEILLAVADTGPGVPPGEESRIFNPFYTTKEEGTGLGLAIVQQIVSRHGGRIDVDNSENGGAVFTVRLPARPAGAEDAPPDEADGAGKKAGKKVEA